MLRKNILFLFSDQHRGDWMPYHREVCTASGLPPLPLKMRNLRRLIDEGVTFTRAVTNSPLCVPARACLASGQDYERCGTWNNDFCFSLSQPTFYNHLHNAGYTVAGVGKFDLHKPVMYWGENGWIPQLSQLGFTRAAENEGKGDAVWACKHTKPGPYGNFLRSRGLLDLFCTDHLRRQRVPTDASTVDLPQKAYSDNYVTANAVSMLQDVLRKPDPWFLMVNFSGPHDPWDVTPAMRAPWANTSFPIPDDYTGNQEDLQKVRQNYAAMLENIDACIGALLTILESSGQLEDTVIIYSSDHGEMLGDRNRFYKSVPYLPSIHIPLVIRSGSCRGTVCGHLVQLNDLASTITDFAGLGPMPGTDSRSLLNMTTQSQTAPVRDFQYTALYPQLTAPRENRNGYEMYSAYWKSSGSSTGTLQNGWRSIVTKSHQYIEYLEPPSKELYDLRTDPGEHHNLVSEEPILAADMQMLLESHVTVKK